MNERLVIAVEECKDNVIKVAEHFGRCTKLNVYEINQDKEVIKKETHFNPLSGNHNGQCQLPGYINQFNVSTIIAGGMGRKAVANFHSFGIDVITAPGLNIEEALNLFLQGKLSGYEECSGHGH